MDLHVIWRGVVVRSIRQINISPAVWVRILHEHIYLFMFLFFIFFLSFLFFTCHYRYGSAKLNMI